jgi:hypothetical protein
MNFTHNKMHYAIGFGRGDETEPVTEVFVHCGKSGTEAEAWARDSAVLLSLALQYGVPLLAINGAITRTHDDKPAGPLGVIVEMILKDTVITGGIHAAKDGME